MVLMSVKFHSITWFLLKMYHKDVAKISTGILRLCTPLQEDVSLFVSQAHFVFSSSTIVDSHGK